MKKARGAGASREQEKARDRGPDEPPRPRAPRPAACKAPLQTPHVLHQTRGPELLSLLGPPSRSPQAQGQRSQGQGHSRSFNEEPPGEKLSTEDLGATAAPEAAGKERRAVGDARHATVVRTFHVTWKPRRSHYLFRTDSQHMKEMTTVLKIYHKIMRVPFLQKTLPPLLSGYLAKGIESLKRSKREARTPRLGITREPQTVPAKGAPPPLRRSTEHLGV